MSLLDTCDLHVHTSFSPCAARNMTVRSIADSASKRGIKHLGITDHINADTDTGILGAARREIESLSPKLSIYLGCEADIIADGEHAVTQEMIDSLDFIAVAANHFHVSTVAWPEDSSLEGVGRHFVEMFRYACSLEFVDVIVHPMYVYAGTFDPTCLDLVNERDLKQAIEMARENSIAMEISPRALDRQQMFFRMKFYTMCKDAGLKFSLGTDAHRLEMVGQTKILAPLIRQLGLTDDDIWLPATREG